MQKLYGFREKDVITLIDKLKERKGASLTQVFLEVASLLKKSKGTIRNMYYSVAKLSIESEEFRNEYLGGEKLFVFKPTPFTKKEESALLSEIKKGKENNISARKVILKMANGDEKLALRFQNKYRNIKAQGGASEDLYNAEEKASKFYLAKLKREINGLVEKIAEKTLKENEILKQRVTVLEKENAELYKKLNLIDENKGAKDYFLKKGKGALVN